MRKLLIVLMFAFASFAFCNSTDPCVPEEPETPDTEEPQECMSVELEE